MSIRLLIKTMTPQKKSLTNSIDTLVLSETTSIREPDPSRNWSKDESIKVEGSERVTSERGEFLG